jgi:hypothetical protein
MWSVDAQTPKTCIPDIGFLPGFGMGGPPVWWDANNNSTFPELPAENDQVTDPRWTGSGAHTDGSPGSQEMWFQTIKSVSGGTTYLSMSWQVQLDPAPDLSTDLIWLGLSPDVVPNNPSPGDTVVLRFKLGTTSGGMAMSQPDYTPEAYLLKNNALVAYPGGTVPTWVTETGRLWIQQVGTKYTWAFQIRIPLSAAGVATGLNLRTNFHAWYQVNVKLGPGGGTAYYSWPRTVGPITGAVTASSFPPVAQWGAFTLNPASAEPDCEGIELSDWSQIGTKNPQPNTILFDNPGTGTPTDAYVNTKINTFFARPKNKTSASVPQGAIAMKVRVAAWGSQGYWGPATNYNYGQTWTEITPPNLGQLPTNRGSIAAGQTATDAAANDINWDWTVPDCMVFDFLPGTLYPPKCSPLPPERYEKDPHQCMLVELSSTGTANPLSFISRSVVRNMDFESASVVKRSATISIAGLPPIAGAGPNRAVYLYVETLNMPREVKGRDTVGRGADDNVGRRAVLAAAGSIAAQQLDAIMPTYRVHVYHETGDTIVTDGVKSPAVRSQYSFGYWIEHQGSLHGWLHKLEGAQAIAPNLYKISIPNDGTAQVTTTIEALEKPCGCFCRLFKGGSVASLESGSFPLLKGNGLPLLVGVTLVGLTAYAPRRRKPRAPRDAGE